MNNGTRDLVLSEARRLFDVAGVTKANHGNWLILGLTSDVDQELDEFVKTEDGSIDFLSGFRKHVAPRLEELQGFLSKHSIESIVFGPIGYPRGDEMNLKLQAVVAGICDWARNGMVIHPDYGLSLRFAIMKTFNTEFEETGGGCNRYELSPLCLNCSVCQEACPYNIISEGRLTEITACRSRLQRMTGENKLQWCRVCIDACPVGGRRIPILKG